MPAWRQSSPSPESWGFFAYAKTGIPLRARAFALGRFATGRDAAPLQATLAVVPLPWCGQHKNIVISPTLLASFGVVRGAELGGLRGDLVPRYITHTCGLTRYITHAFLWMDTLYHPRLIRYITHAPQKKHQCFQWVKCVIHNRNARAHFLTL